MSVTRAYRLLRVCNTIVPATLTSPERVQVALSAYELVLLLELLDNDPERDNPVAEDALARVEAALEDAFTDITGDVI